jgi:hypothetical protein
MKDRSARAHFGRIEYIRFDLTPEEEPRFFADFQFAKHRQESSEECLSYELSKATARGQFVLRIEWDSSSARWPVGHKPEAVHRFLLSLKSGLKTVTEIVACEPVRDLLPFTLESQHSLPFNSEKV